jgi:hypothetical protein
MRCTDWGKALKPRVAGCLLALASIAAWAQTSPPPDGRIAKAQEIVAGKPWMGSTEEYATLEPAVAKQIDESADAVVQSLRKDSAWNPDHPKWAATREQVRDDMRSAWMEAGRAALGGIDPSRYQEHLAGLYLAALDDAALDALLGFYRSADGARFTKYLTDLARATRDGELAAMDLFAGGPPRWEGQDPARMRLRIETLLVLEPMRGMANVARDPADAELASGMSATLLTIAAVSGEKIEALRAGLDDTSRAAIEAFEKTPERIRERALLVAESERIFRASREWSSALPAFLKKLEAQEEAWKKLAGDATR